jgi:hypothetical protein
MQIEHATLPPYLTALYSIKQGTNQDATQILRVVAVEEMLHLTLAANLLNAVGGIPDVTHPGFVPEYPAYLPDGEDDFQVHLASFSPDTVDTFLKIERPSMAGSAEGAKVILPSQTHSRRHAHLGRHPDDDNFKYSSIGEFYAAIEAGMDELEKEAQREGRTIFTGKRDRQITSEFYYSGGGRLFEVVDLNSARVAIQLIIQQGEGETRLPHGNFGELAHYYRFEQLKLGQYYQPTDDVPGRPTGPTFSVDWSAVCPIASDLKLDAFPAGSELRAMAEAFNSSYGEFLGLLNRAYNGERALLFEAVPQMFEFRNQIQALIRNPLPGTTWNAAPTFQV